MYHTQRKNLTESVAHWANNVERHKQNLLYRSSSSSCACCQQCAHYTPEKALNIVCLPSNQFPDALPCPIAEYTNLFDCDGTPWKTSVTLDMPEIEHHWLSELLAGNDPPIFTHDLFDYDSPDSETQARTQDPENQFWIDWYNTPAQPTQRTTPMPKDGKVTYKQQDCYISDESFNIDFNIDCSITPNMIVLGTSKIAGPNDSLNFTIFEAKTLAALTFHSKVQAIVLVRKQHNTSLNLAKLICDRLAYLLSTDEL